MMTEYIHCERVPYSNTKQHEGGKECKHKIHNTTPREKTEKKNTKGSYTKKK
jgi:hypothetical protein